MCLEIVFLLLLLGFVTEQAHAQGIQRNDIELGVWGGFSPNSSTFWLGETEGRRFFALALRFGWVAITYKELAVEYVVDFYPVAFVSNNPHFDRGDDGMITVTGEGPVYGIGLSPVGVEVSVFRKRRVRVFGNSSIGFVSFTREMPVPEARTFNYEWDFGGGVQFDTASQWAITIGFKLHHLSNWYTAKRNPGLDNNVFYFGMSKFL